MPFADLPPSLQDRVVCSIAAAVRYAVPANLVLAIAEKEGGRPGQWVRNRNGTHDVGPLQFNTGYLRELGRYGIAASDVAGAGCYPFELAAWRLRGHLKNDRGDLWTRAANYHSRTPRFNTVYRADLRIKAGKWADWLEARFVTLDLTRPGALPNPPRAALPSAARTGDAATPTAARPLTRLTWERSGYVPRMLIVPSPP